MVSKCKRTRRGSERRVGSCRPTDYVIRCDPGPGVVCDAGFRWCPAPLGRMSPVSTAAYSARWRVIFGDKSVVGALPWSDMHCSVVGVVQARQTPSRSVARALWVRPARRPGRERRYRAGSRDAVPWARQFLQAHGRLLELALGLSWLSDRHPVGSSITALRRGPGVFFAVQLGARRCLAVGSASCTCVHLPTNDDSSVSRVPGLDFRNANLQGLAHDAPRSRPTTSRGGQGRVQCVRCKVLATRRGLMRGPARKRHSRSGLGAPECSREAARPPLARRHRQAACGCPSTSNNRLRSAVSDRGPSRGPTRGPKNAQS